MCSVRNSLGGSVFCFDVLEDIKSRELYFIVKINIFTKIVSIHNFF
jgi:hypothetical protein